jgi:hypothetical protein
MPAVVLDQPSTIDRSARNVAADPLATFPRRIRGHSGDGRSLELLTSRTGVAVVAETGRLAEIQVAEETDRVVVDIRTDLFALPDDVVPWLLAEAFAHPAVRAQRSVLVTLPARRQRRPGGGPGPPGGRPVPRRRGHLPRRGPRPHPPLTARAVAVPAPVDARPETALA